MSSGPFSRDAAQILLYNGVNATRLVVGRCKSTATWMTSRKTCFLCFVHSFIHSFIHSLFAIYTKFYNARLEYEIKETVNGEET